LSTDQEIVVVETDEPYEDLLARCHAAEAECGRLSHAIVDAWLSGFMASREDWNGDTPFEGRGPDDALREHAAKYAQRLRRRLLIEPKKPVRELELVTRGPVVESGPISVPSAV
jgi:hypothetical protein